MGFRDQLKHAWNAFTNQDPMAPVYASDMGASYTQHPARMSFRISNERSIIASIYTRISVDVASIDIRHVLLDDDERYKQDVKDGLHNCLTLEANIDQNAQHFKQDLVLSMFDAGTIAVCPIDTTVPVDPEKAGVFDIETMRVGKIVQWFPQDVLVDCYNDKTGRHENLLFSKRSVAIMENPLSMVMNEPNSTLQRLIRKLGLLDTVDEQSSSGKLDMIIQLPFTIRSESKRKQADQRRKDIEWQLKGSKYGIAYTDGLEKITQLNRPAENNLFAQVEYLTNMLYTQLGITPSVMDGTADEKAMLNYMNRTVEPILECFALEFKRKFLSKTARTRGHSIAYFRDPFKLVPLSEFAEIADKLTRNEITSSNEIRQFIGMKPSKDPKADELRNSNMPPPPPGAPAETPAPSDEGGLEEDPFAGINEVLDEVFAELGEEG